MSSNVIVPFRGWWENISHETQLYTTCMAEYRPYWVCVWYDTKTANGVMVRVVNPIVFDEGGG